MKPNKTRWALISSACLFLSTSVSGFAAIVSVDAIQKYDSAMTPPSNLTTEGTLDWAYWTSTSGSTVASPVAPTNEKSGGTLLGSLTALGTSTGLRGSTTADAWGRYTWTDGTSTPTGTNANLAGGLVFPNVLGSNGQGFSFTLQGNPLTPYYIVLHAGGFAATGNLVLLLNGVQMATDASLTFTNVGPKQVAAYQILFQPDNASDVLTVQFTSAAVTDTSFSHVGIEAITVGLLPVIPEPTAVVLSGIGALFLIGKRRR